MKEIIYGRSRKEITSMFNDRFGLELREGQIIGFIKNRHIKNGLNGRFHEGHVPFNKGKNMGGWEPTQFKPGSRPYNYMPVGSERVNTMGYVDIKTADPKTWKQKHILIWEKANGAVPVNHVLIFADHNRLNVVLENLLLVSRSELLIMINRGLITSNAELTRTGVIVAGICIKIADRKKK